MDFFKIITYSGNSVFGLPISGSKLIHLRNLCTRLATLEFFSSQYFQKTTCQTRRSKFFTVISFENILTSTSFNGWVFSSLQWCLWAPVSLNLWSGFYKNRLFISFIITLHNINSTFGSVYCLFTTFVSLLSFSSVLATTLLIAGNFFRNFSIAAVGTLDSSSNFSLVLLEFVIGSKSSLVS